MKLKLWLLGALIGFFTLLSGWHTLWAISDIWISSHTASADTGQALCTQPNTSRRGVLHAVCVNDGTTGSVTIYNSSATAVNPVAVIRSTAALLAGCSLYDIGMSSGIVYTNPAGNDTTFIYNCY